MNKVLKFLILSDIVLFTGFGFIAPIISIFISDRIVGGSIFTAGVASTIFLITHALLQIAFSYWFKPKDRMWMLILGTALIAIVPFGYLVSTNIWHIFILEFIYGAGAGFAYPSWSSLFTANLEKGKRGFQYAIYSSGVGIGSAITGTIGAWVAENIGFQWVFIFTGVFAVAGLLLLLLLNKKEALKKI
jgi:DHA1 family quinolone resistance protein-like MFS transporter